VNTFCGWFVKASAARMLQILVLLDVNPEESMLDEGLAREVVNRIQKLRKKVIDFSLYYILLMLASVTLTMSALVMTEFHCIPSYYFSYAAFSGLQIS